MTFDSSMVVEPAEMAGLVAILLLVQPAELGGDATDHLARRARDEQLALGVLEIGVLLAAQRLLALEIERRDSSPSGRDRGAWAARSKSLQVRRAGDLLRRRWTWRTSVDQRPARVGSALRI
jgi:hypothetical protein